MRVISGKYKGRKLVAPTGLNTRPTLDRVKETLFNIIAGDLHGARVLDLFAGSGQLGVECLSRGASEVVFVDGSREAINCIKQNLSFVTDKNTVLFAKYPAVLGLLVGQFDVVLLDPPFKSGVYTEVMEELLKRNLLNDNALVVCECDVKQEMPQNIGSLVLEKQRKAGSAVSYSFYRKEEI